MLNTLVTMYLDLYALLVFKWIYLRYYCVPDSVNTTSLYLDLSALLVCTWICLRFLCVPGSVYTTGV